jgi:sec-independent protein translocase protein TatA
MFDLSGPHIVILLVVILLLFGSTRLPRAAKSLGQSMHIFKRSVAGLDVDDESDANPFPPNQSAASPFPPSQSAGALPPPGTPQDQTQAQLADLQRQIAELQKQTASGNAGQTSQF